MMHSNHSHLILMRMGLACALGFSNITFAEHTERLYRRVQDAESIDRLPKHVKAKSGELTLFADYTDIRDYGIVLYLVNRTDRRIDFATEDDDVHVMLEALSESRRWERAQTVHDYVGCGNSYYNRTLAPGEFFRFLGYQPTEGKPTTIRYRMYTDSVNPISNAGPGRARSAEIVSSRRDRLVLGFGSFDAVRDLALGTVRGTWLGGSRPRAVEALRRFPPEVSTEVFIALLGDADGRVREEAIKSIGMIGAEFPPAEERFQALLTDENVDRRAVAIRTLSDRTLSRDVIRDARRLLGDMDVKIRGAALVVLGKACGEFPEVHKILIEYGNDPDPVLQRFLKNAQERKLGWCPESKTAE